MISVIKNINGAFVNLRHGHESFADVSGHSFNFMNIDHVILLANGYAESIKMMQEAINLCQEVTSKYTLGDLIPEFFSNAKSVGYQYLRLLGAADYLVVELFIRHLGDFNKKFKLSEKVLEEVWRMLEFFTNEKQILEKLESYIHLY